MAYASVRLISRSISHNGEKDVPGHRFPRCPHACGSRWRDRTAAMVPRPGLMIIFVISA
jgi:hypothetical protein